ncbi:MAG: hypothetical protein WBD07_05140 [Vicinamibacterales bacterium]
MSRESTDFEWHAIRRGTMIYAGVMAAVFIFGGAYLAFASPTSHEVTER